MHNKITNNPTYQFWFLQLGYWLFICLISLSTLTLWYAQLNWENVAHTLLQSALGLLLSIPLYFVYMKYWEHSVRRRLSVLILGVLITSFAWTIARMQAFIMMTPEYDIWVDFGGWYFGSILVYLSWAALVHGVKYYQLLQLEHSIMLNAEAEAKAELLKRISAQTEARDAQIKMLRYQLNPHFLCNTLNAINSLIEMEESTIAQSMTVKLSKFLRYSLDHNPDNKIALKNEINALNLYLDIEKTRFGERLKLDFQIDENAQLAKIPSLLLQPVIENSMKHVIAQNEDGGTISLKAKVVDNQLNLEICDTGSGIKMGRSKLQISQGRGVGLRNIDERLKVLYQHNYSFELNISAAGGLKTTIKIPYEPQADS
ncbi:histidine kinase [Thalassotalea psychrophila]|uniref:Histidine kinase n=1 Tax=Thalassotalea psychrophila TaxID=3065647 RepID=A0ABY9TSF0_9GAMM|nr:histidine kinase [Colwelliaceae bacterium SQ149]